MILPSAKVDSIIQVDDLFRVDLSASTTHDGSELDVILVSPDEGLEAIEIFNPTAGKERKVLDWQFGTSGEKLLTITFIQGEEVKEITRSVLVKNASEEKLFSDDEMLLKLEHSINDLLPAGRSSFIYAHRMAQNEILRDLKERGFQVTAAQIFNIEDVSFWSKYLALAFIFESNVTSNVDIHTRKKLAYLAEADTARTRVIIKLDKNGDGKVDEEISSFPARLRLG
jgi:hypothetical protein